ncbi:alpha/beta fold hydrolase [Nocardia sp. NPDC020380]|uniref:alpha/beta fold hydrolase n=1 Tax=Nocardia sp. NPDC020380 TaxID=3364309 RepID=UPI0037A7827A
MKGGQGPAIVLLHGWPEDLHAFQKVAPDLAKDHTVVAVDLPGFGDSGFARSDDGYQALAVASDVHAVAQKLSLGRVDIIGHDWGGAIGLAYAAEYRADVAHLAILEAPPTGDYLNQVQTKPGTFWWDWLANGPKNDLADQLIEGKEPNFYGSFYREADGDIDKSESDGLIAAYSKPGRTHAGLEYFRQRRPEQVPAPIARSQPEQGAADRLSGAVGADEQLVIGGHPQRLAHTAAAPDSGAAVHNADSTVR